LTIKRQNYLNSRLLVLLIFLTLLLSLPSHALTEITLEWLPVTEPNVAGYRVFSRLDEEAYDYGMPLWEGAETSCVIDFPEDEITWYFVVRVFDEEGYESIDSNEVCYRCFTYDHVLNNDNDGPVESDTGCFVRCLPL